MEDLMAQLQSILSTQEGQDQLKNVASMLGMNNNTTQQQASPPPQQNQQQGFDLSSLASMFQGQSNSTNNNTDNNSNNNQTASGFDLSSLASLFSQTANTTGQPNPAPSMPNIDMGTLLKVQQAFSSMNMNDKNSELLLSLKPHFSDKRQKKVDQAINIMRMIKMLPMIKESGLFG